MTWNWNSGPIPDGTAIDWGVVSQFYAAIDEREAVTGDAKLAVLDSGGHPIYFDATNCCGRFPKSQTPWGTGIVSAITATTLTPDVMPEKCGGVNPVDHDWTTGCSSINPVPTSWDIVIDDCDPTKVVRAHVESNDDATFTISDISDYVTSKFISSLSSLLGKRFYLIKAGGPWWSERIMQWGSSVLEDARGSVSSATTSSLTCLGRTWVNNSLVGKDLLVSGGGKLRRVTVTSNTAETIKFAPQSWTPSHTFIVIAAGAKGHPDRLSDYTFRWDFSPTDGYYTHYPDDAVDGDGNPPVTQLPKGEITWIEGEGSACGDDPPPLAHCDSQNSDCWSSLTNECGPADDAKNADVFRTIRGLQLAAEGMSGSFVDPGTAIPFSLATWFYRAGINAQSSTCSGRDVDGHLLVSISAPYEPIEVHYAVLGKIGCTASDAIEDVLTSGTATYQGGKILASFGADYDTPRQVVVSFGWTRVIEREFRWRGERRVFIADEKGIGGLFPCAKGGATDPPRVFNYEDCGCQGTGVYETRFGPSTTYVEATPRGFVLESADTPQIGDIARWIGDNWNDPANYQQQAVESPTPYYIKYYDRMYEGKHQPITQQQLRAQLQGTATSGGNFYLTQDTHDWWREFWYPKGSGRDETGTFTSGSTLGGTDNTKIKDTEAGCFCDAQRFGGGISGVGGFVEFIIEINIGGTWHKRVVRTGVQSAGGMAFTWNEPLPASANGKQWRIREAYGYVVNRFKDRAATLTEPDGATTHQVTIIANDDKTIFFDAASFIVTADWTFKIDDPTIDPAPGGLYQWDGSNWNAVTTPAQATRVLRFGHATRSDMVGLHLLNELRAAINVLQNTHEDVDISNREDDDVEENNAKEVFYVGTGCMTNPDPQTGENCTQIWPDCWGEVLDNQTADWNATVGYNCLGEVSGFPCQHRVGKSCVDDGMGNIIAEYFNYGVFPETGLPYAYWAGCACESMCGVAVRRRYCYVSVSGLSTCRPVAVEIWGKAGADGYDCPSLAPGGCAKTEFSANSDGVGTWGNWFHITTASEISDDGSTKKFRVGDPSFPLPDRPSLPNVITRGSCSCRSYKGYQMTAVKAVAHWTFTYHG